MECVDRSSLFLLTTDIRELLSGAKFLKADLGAETPVSRKAARADTNGLTGVRGTDSFEEMIRERALQKRHKLIEQLPVTGELLRGTLLNRIVRHKSGCPKCERGEGHPVSVLAVTYPGGRTRQISLRPEQVPEVRRRLDNYHRVKNTLEQICELNQEALRAETAETKSEGRERD